MHLEIAITRRHSFEAHQACHDCDTGKVRAQVYRESERCGETQYFIVAILGLCVGTSTRCALFAFGSNLILLSGNRSYCGSRTLTSSASPVLTSWRSNLLFPTSIRFTWMGCIAAPPATGTQLYCTGLPLALAFSSIAPDSNSAPASLLACRHVQRKYPVPPGRSARLHHTAGCASCKRICCSPAFHEA
ncbi:hypothetical protein EJ03DRAFT_41733 [Teratosphaeria nubilosa]|uniref:Uncharacterized protein n=1 Tax=Teratosphaeria nubilosa TaxID=161662 RepID=A0A6G1KTU0_9PEZI|nr:hypothetical protein EJ03DRAFT_41733 [Teratosphaeria nubilosa]